MRGSFSSSMLADPGEGGCQPPVIRGSGIRVTGMPFFKNVGGFGAVDATEREDREAGREDEIIGLSVRRLWMSGFFDRRVRTPVEVVGNRAA